MKPLILLVEDEEALLTMLRYNLEREGFEVAVAMNGEEALIAIEERRPDVVLLDWMLPLVSGIEVCRQVRRNPETRDLPIIMLTARGEEGDKIRALNSGADSYMTDFEDSNAPNWDNQVQGQVNLRAAIRRELSLDSGGKR